MIHGEYISVSTRGFSDIHDVTGHVQRIVTEAGIRSGLACVFVVGSTASVSTIEFEPALTEDMRDQLEKFAPHTMRTRHSETWGDDNGFSHIRATMMGPGITVPVHEGALVLGTWQQIVVIDHDNRARTRKVFVQVMGE
ncbi:secondary thiamine-phosphate synthase enzyme YjbQ [bacterium]|nr:secondary thiamine-phosphate synthase enzyme YjbQ [bacterium]MBU1984387.1 secondary thiamine-phosphate synthase enzyme YjbQ [bacterium]